jgi:Na+-driven multidrug efflux pump
MGTFLRSCYSFLCRLVAQGIWLSTVVGCSLMAVMLVFCDNILLTMGANAEVHSALTNHVCACDTHQHTHGRIMATNQASFLQLAHAFMNACACDLPNLISIGSLCCWKCHQKYT